MGGWKDSELVGLGKRVEEKAFEGVDWS